MTPLRMRMIQDMRAAGLASGTQAIYLDGVRHLAAHYGRSPDLLSEAEVRAYLIGLRERGVALGTFKTNHGGIQFLYRQTLDLDWQLFGEKKDPPAEAAPPAGCFARQPGQGPPGLCRQPCAPDVPFPDVWLRFADRRGDNSGDRRD
jgi:Phage integrase, N-terminal SAM-like domain